MEDKIKTWLLERNISEKVLGDSGIHWNGNKIVIPVRDVAGKFIFNKYRKNPFSINSEEPKYTYEKGSTSSLYNAHNIQPNRPVFIVEGELDSLLLQSCGLNAVSSTGGSGSFKPEWASFIRDKTNEIYICYDRDAAGFKGAIRVQQMLPCAKIIMLPYTLKGKDITDFFFQYKMPQFLELVQEAESWVLPKEPEGIPETKKDTDKIIKELNTSLDEFTDRRIRLNNDNKPTEYADIIIETLNKRIIAWKNIRNQPKADKLESDGKREAAKKVPINNFLKFNGAGFAPCVFHSDSHPSMRYYKQSNVVHCFSCQTHADSIAVYMKLNNCTFKEAIERMVG